MNVPRRTMKKLLIALFALLPLTVSSAITQYRMTWNTLPGDQVVIGECQVNNNPYTQVGQAPGNGNIDFSLDVNSGDTISCRAFTTKPGFPNSALSEVAVVIVPLVAPQGVRVAPRP